MDLNNINEVKVLIQKIEKIKKEMEVIKNLDTEYESGDVFSKGLNLMLWDCSQEEKKEFLKALLDLKEERLNYYEMELRVM